MKILIVLGSLFLLPTSPARAQAQARAQALTQAPKPVLTANCAASVFVKGAQNEKILNKQSKFALAEGATALVYSDAKVSYEISAVQFGSSINFQALIVDVTSGKRLAVQNISVQKQIPEFASVTTESLPGYEAASLTCWMR